MTPKETAAASLRKDLRAWATGYPDVEEGVACAGTSAERRTVKARGKAFLFLGTADAMMKLSESVGEATRRAAKEPDRYKVGAGGWVTVKFGPGGGSLGTLLRRWLDESYRAMA